MSEKTLFEEEAEEIDAIFCKNITDEKKENAIDPILDRVVMKIIPEANTIDEDFKMLFKDIFNYFINVIKKPVIQNFMNSGKNPEAVFGMMMLDILENSQVGDLFKDKQDDRWIFKLYKLLIEHYREKVWK